MLRPLDAIEGRLEDLKSDEHRTKFDSKLRAIQMDVPAKVGAPKNARKSEADRTFDQVISLLEEMSRRIDALEKKDRALADEIRHRARQDYCRRSAWLASGLAASGLLCLGRMMSWF